MNSFRIPFYFVIIIILTSKPLLACEPAEFFYGIGKIFLIGLSPIFIGLLVSYIIVYFGNKNLPTEKHGHLRKSIIGSLIGGYIGFFLGGFVAFVSVYAGHSFWSPLIAFTIIAICLGSYTGFFISKDDNVKKN